MKHANRKHPMITRPGHLVSIFTAAGANYGAADNLISNRNIKSEHASLRSASPPRERDSSPHWKVFMWHYALLVGGVKPLLL